MSDDAKLIGKVIGLLACAVAMLLLGCFLGSIDNDPCRCPDCVGKSLESRPVPEVVTAVAVVKRIGHAKTEIHDVEIDGVNYIMVFTGPGGVAIVPKVRQ